MSREATTGDQVATASLAAAAALGAALAELTALATLSAPESTVLALPGAPAIPQQPTPAHDGRATPSSRG